MIPREALERWLRASLRGLLSVALILAVAGIWGFTLGADEGWNLSSIGALSGDPRLAFEMQPVLTSGGLFAALQGALFAAGAESLWSHRVLSLLAALSALVLAWQLLPRGARDADQRWLVAAGIVAAPGALTLAGLAHAEWMATALAVAFVVLWERMAGRGTKRILVCGAVLGLALATRSTAIALVPGFLAWSLIGSRDRVGRVREAVATSALAGLVLVGATALYTAASPSVPGARETLTVMGLTGLIPDYPRVMNRWLVGERLMPAASLIAVTALVMGWGHRRTDRPATWTLLVAFAWSGWALWMLRAPIPHLRYLWPAAGALGIAAGLGLAALHASGSSRARVAALAVAVGITLGPVGIAARHLLNGQTDLVMWEWSGEAPLSYTRRFQHVQDQHAAAAWIRAHLGPDEEIAVFSQPFAMRLLTGRNFHAFWDFVEDDPARWKDRPLPGWILLQPTNHAYRYLGTAAKNWISESCTVEAQFGSYVVYRVRGPWPEDPTRFEVERRPDLRFPLAKPRFGE